MRYIYFLLAIITISFSSCRDDFKFEASTGGLEFSKDTVYLDTVFTNIGSSTYKLKVYNRSDKDISIPKIALHKGDNSKFRLMVDGMTGDVGHTGKQFSNVELMARDSLFIFIEVTADVANANPTDFLYTDKIDFIHGNGETQDVDLVTLIQDAIFIYPNRTETSPNIYEYESALLGLDTDNKPIISENTHTLINNHPQHGNELHWTNTKPYVIYGFAFVPDGSELVVDKGARVYYHANSGLMIGRNGKLTINGENPTTNPLENDLSKEVIFEGDRLEYSFDNVAGQWFGIVNFSTNLNSIKHLTIKNASIGIYNLPLEITVNPNTAKLNIKQSKIQNCSIAGIYSIASTITAENVVVNNCGKFCVGLTYGGIYNFSHCTFNNNWYGTNQTCLYLTDYFETSDTIYANNSIKNYIFTDCIIYGSNQNELAIGKKNDTSAMNYVFNNCLIKYNNTNSNPLYPPINSTNYTNCYIATNNTLHNPKFKNVSKHQLWPTENINSAVNIIEDILGNPSNNQIGAYKTITN